MLQLISRLGPRIRMSLLYAQFPAARLAVHEEQLVAPSAPSAFDVCGMCVQWTCHNQAEYACRVVVIEANGQQRVRFGDGDGGGRGGGGAGLQLSGYIIVELQAGPLQQPRQTNATDQTQQQHQQHLQVVASLALLRCWPKDAHLMAVLSLL